MPRRGFQVPASLISVPTLLLVCLAVYLPFFWQLPLIRSEAMYALIPREMMVTGSWLTPMLNGVQYLDKPHLIYWLNLLAYKIFGVSDWAARVPTLAVTLGEVWVTFLLGRRLLGPTAAWLGGFVLLSSIGFFSLHLQILTDHLISLSLAASLYFLLRWREEPSLHWAALFHLCLVVGFLGKGFIGLAFPLLIGALYAMRLRKGRLWALFLSPLGLSLLLIVLVPWIAGVEAANPGFIKFQIINEQVLRFLGQRQPPDINTFSIPGFWIFLGLWLLPWTVLLPEALYRFWRETRPGRRVGPGGSLLLIWPAVILGFFTLSSSRIEYYSLPALPPLALIAGWRLREYLGTPKDRSLIAPLILIALLGLALLALLPSLEGLCADNRREFIGMFSLLKPVAWLVTLIVPGLALAGAVTGWRHPRLAVASLGALALTLTLLTFQSLMALSPHLSDKLPGEYLRSRAQSSDVVVMEHIEEFEYGASLAFYANHRILMVQRHGLPEFPYPVAEERDYLITPGELKKLWQGPRRVFVLVDDAVKYEPALEGAQVALTVPGKRLLVNRP